MTGGLDISRGEAAAELKAKGVSPEWRAPLDLRESQEPHAEMQEFAGRVNELLAIVHPGTTIYSSRAKASSEGEGLASGVTNVVILPKPEGERDLAAVEAAKAELKAMGVQIRPSLFVDTSHIRLDEAGIRWREKANGLLKTVYPHLDKQAA